MISTIQRDLQSKNHLEILAALGVLTKLFNQHIMMAIKENIITLLAHPHEQVRKKAILVMMKMHSMFPTEIENMD
jgi:vesicle coat complex subunit